MNHRTITNTANRLYHEALSLLVESGEIDQTERKELVERLATAKAKTETRKEEEAEWQALKQEADADEDLNREDPYVHPNAGEPVRFGR